MNKTVKKIIIVFLLFIIAILLNQNKVYADDEIGITLCTIGTNAIWSTSGTIIGCLNEAYGYTMDYIYNPLFLNNVSLTATKIDSDSYSVKIGNEDDDITEDRGYLSFNQIQALGFTGSASGIAIDSSVTWTTTLQIGVSRKTHWYTARFYSNIYICN